MPQDLTESSAGPWTTTITVPLDGERITADAAPSPVNPAFQALLDRDAQMVLGTVTYLSLTVDGVGEDLVTPTPGLIGTTGDVVALGLIQAGQQVEAGTEHFTGTGAGKVHMTQKGLLWNDITNNSATGPNPARTLAILNQMRAINTPKAWAIVRTFDVAYPGYFVDGCGFTLGAVSSGTPSTFTFTMAQNMSSTNYVVIASAINVASGNIAPINSTWKLTRTTSTFVLESAFNLATTNTEIMVHVFGRQST